MRNVRGLLIAIVALALSAGAVFAALPQAASFGLATSLQARSDHPAASPDPSRAPDGLESPEPSESPDAAGPGESPDAGQPADAQGAQGEHGALVSQAAQGDTPPGWQNHGAYVSAVARGEANPGDPAPAGSTTHGKAHHGKPSN